MIPCDNANVHGYGEVYPVRKMVGKLMDITGYWAVLACTLRLLCMVSYCTNINYTGGG